jgi:hypothetical protein
MHGRIELATAPSGGLEVNLWLPVALAATIPQSPPKARETGPSLTRDAEGGIERVLALEIGEPKAGCCARD